MFLLEVWLISGMPISGRESISNTLDRRRGASSEVWDCRASTILQRRWVWSVVDSLAPVKTDWRWRREVDGSDEGALAFLHVVKAYI